MTPAICFKSYWGGVLDGTTLGSVWVGKPGGRAVLSTKDPTGMCRQHG